jgi:hypothetical protein
MVFVAPTATKLHDSQDNNFQGFQLFPNDALRHSHPQIFHQQSHTSVFRVREGVTAVRKPLAINWTDIKFSPFIWAIRSPGQFDRNQAKKLKT